jgi:phosphatidylglycerophosphate synthase
MVIHNFARAALPMSAAGPLLLLGGGLALAVEPLEGPGRGVTFAFYGLVAALVLAGLGHHAPHRRFGVANLVTLARAAAAALFLGVCADAVWGGLILGPQLRWALGVTAAAALAGDGIDGWIARRHGRASAFGARFDMETDALMILALAALAVAAGQAGRFVLLSGAMRYLFLAAGWAWPVLAAPLPPSFRRQAVCVAQTALLILALLPPVPPGIANALCAAGLLLLLWSFAVDSAGALSGGRHSHIMR